MGCWVFNGKIQNRINFSAKNRYPQRKMLYFGNWHSGESSTLGIILENKASQKLKILKNTWWQKMCSKLKNQKNLENWFWKSGLRLFDILPRVATALCQFTKYNNFPWGYCFLAKNIFNYVFLLWKNDSQYDGGTAYCPDFQIVPISSLVPIYQNHSSKKLSPFTRF